MNLPCSRILFFFFPAVLDSAFKILGFKILYIIQAVLYSFWDCLSSNFCLRGEKKKVFLVPSQVLLLMLMRFEFVQILVVLKLSLSLFRCFCEVENVQVFKNRKNSKTLR